MSTSGRVTTVADLHHRRRPRRELSILRLPRAQPPWPGRRRPAALHRIA
ncbi:hypothetical protein [Nonomuraea deserti]|nr:hypothetical protein [Nonomuraea deserti]